MPNASLNFSLESLKSKTVADESSSFRMRAFMIYDGVVLLFKDSMERVPRNLGVPDSHTTYYYRCTDESKDQTQHTLRARGIYLGL
jgi:hypothetical protein